MTRSHMRKIGLNLKTHEHILKFCKDKLLNTQDVTHVILILWDRYDIILKRATKIDNKYFPFYTYQWFK